jgi:hypothetical protein
MLRSPSANSLSCNQSIRTRKQTSCQSHNIVPKPGFLSSVEKVMRMQQTRSISEEFPGKSSNADTSRSQIGLQPAFLQSSLPSI